MSWLPKRRLNRAERHLVASKRTYWERQPETRNDKACNDVMDLLSILDRVAK